MLVPLSFQHIHCVSVQRNASRRSVLGLVQPGSAALQVNPVPFQAGKSPLIEGTGDLPTARTAGFTVLVFAQLFNCFNARSETTSAFAHLFVSPWLWGAVALSTLLQVGVGDLDFLNLAFGTVPLTLDQWLLCAAMASLVLWFSELRKWLSRVLGRRLTLPPAEMNGST